MARNLRRATIGLAIVTALVVPLVGGAYVASQRVQPFYAHALQLPPQALKRGSREMESQATALYSDARRPGRWQATFTDEQINGWLARQQADGQLPDAFSEPRVAMFDHRVSLGFRSRRGGVETVVAVDATVALTESGEVAVRLTSVRAGALPLPATQAASELAATCQELKLPVGWTQASGEPVALIDVAARAASRGRRVLLDAIELGDGKLVVTGHTEQQDAAPRIADDVQMMNDD